MNSKSGAPGRNVNQTANPAIASSGEEIIVEIHFTCNEGNIPAYEALAEAFHATHPHIYVHVGAIEPFLEQAGVTTDTVKRWEPLLTASDVVGWSMEPELSRLGLIKDLTPFLEADSTFDREDFYTFMIEHYRWDNGLWALPAWAIPEVIFYDKNAFDQAGLSYPQPGWNQEEFRQTIAQLTRREGGEIIQYGFVDSDLLAFLPLMRGLIADDPFELQSFNTPEIAEVLGEYKSLLAAHTIAPPGQSEIVKDGHAAMWGDYLVNWASLRRSGMHNLGIAAFPLGTQPANLFSSPVAYFMSNSTSYPQESWLWMKFLTEHRINDTFGSLNMALPSRRSVVEQTGYWAQWPEEEARVMHFIVEHAVMKPWRIPYLALKQAADATRIGKAIEETLPEVQEQASHAYNLAGQLAPVNLSPHTGVASELTQITFASYGVDTTHYRALADTFNARQNTIHVEVTGPQTVQVADCFVGAADVTQQRSTLNLQPFVESDETLNLDDDYTFVDAFRAQGDMYALPAYAAATVLFYNPALFDTAGLPYPTADWTLDDFLVTAQSLSHGEGDARQYGFAPASGDAGALPLFAALQGAELWAADGQPRFDAPDAVVAVTWYTDLALKHQVMPVSEGLPDITPAETQHLEQRIRSGHVAMWTGLLGLGQASFRSTTNDVGFAPLPGGYVQAFPMGLFIARDSTHANECWQWIIFAAANAPFAPELGLPAHRPALDIQGAATVAMYSPLLDATHLAWTTGNATQQHALLEALAGIYTGESPQAALSEAQQKVNTLP